MTVITSVLLILAVVAGFAVVMTKDMAPTATKVVESESETDTPTGSSQATKVG